MVGMTEPITVLLVEDDSDLRYLEQAALEMDGYTVLPAHDGPEALRIADQHVGPIGLLITDLIIPGIGGQGLARRLRAARPELKVLYVSARRPWLPTTPGFPCFESRSGSTACARSSGSCSRGQEPCDCRCLACRERGGS